jgi:hypothetical protein
MYNIDYKEKVKKYFYLVLKKKNQKKERMEQK